MRRIGIFFLFFLLIFAGTATLLPQTAQAACGCTGCNCADTASAARIIDSFHAQGENDIMRYVSQLFVAHRQWYVETFFKQHILPALQLMTEQMSAVAMEQAFIIGSFLDAKTQLETQRMLQELQAQAHKDYQPSDDFCQFGTSVRSMAASEEKARYSTLVLAKRQMDRHLAKSNVAGGETGDMDKATRWRQFTQKYCDPQDNNWTGTAGTGLSAVCQSAANTKRVNIDVDYTRMVDEPRTLDIDFTDTDRPTEDAQDVLALGNNLYGSDVLARNLGRAVLENKKYQHLYLALRSVAAKRSVAENSYAAIVGMKSSGSPAQAGGVQPNTRAYLGAVMKELGVPDGEVLKLIGNDPSYYAQLEILAKRIYQNPDFFANLYDTPANVERKAVALKAIDLMLDRAIFESQLRQEMVTSVLLSAKLRPQFRDVNRQISGGAE